MHGCEQKKDGSGKNDEIEGCERSQFIGWAVDAVKRSAYWYSWRIGPFEGASLIVCWSHGVTPYGLERNFGFIRLSREGTERNYVIRAMPIYPSHAPNSCNHSSA